MAKIYYSFSDTPCPPPRPTVAEITKTSMTVMWDRPENDGGDRILGYHVERKTKNGLKWIR